MAALFVACGERAIEWRDLWAWYVSRLEMSGRPKPSVVCGEDTASIVILSAVFEGHDKPIMLKAALARATRRVSAPFTLETLVARS